MSAPIAAPTAAPIADGHVVQIHYTLKDDTGVVLDSSEGDEPLAYLHGADNIVPGLEAKLTGRGVGDRVSVKVAPADGYGERAGEPQPVPRDAFPDDLELEEGMQFVAEDDDGELVPIWIAGVEGDVVVVDRNHPLAGVTLNFDVQVVDVRDASPEELEHGHPHGAGGHHH
jgi:FKBP-type peptidyl-prolyl cis-trans isomerase SlyD